MPFRPAGTRKKGLEQSLDARSRAGRAGDDQGTRAPGQELPVEKEKRQPAEMIAVKMGENDRIDPTGIDRLRLQCHQRRSAEIDEHGSAGGLDHEARVESAARTEGIA